jgi:hypothetical protein
MVIYRAKVVRVEPVYGEDNTPIEAWVTFDVQGFKIETFHTGIPVAPELGKVYKVDIDLMTYDFHHINIEEKMLKQISTFPMDPLYILTGELVEVGELKVEEYRGEKTTTREIKIDCGIEIESKVWGWIAEELKVGDYIAIIGKMFGEIVKE